MLTLTTLGGLSLTASDRELTGAVSQRRPMAVLAVVAAAGTTGVSREKLVSLLWADADPERGRRTLTQTLYSLRRATGEDLVTGTADVRLNRAVVACDLLAFDEALRERRPADAAAAYGGPFLDGFTLAGAPEFERWLDAERDRISRRCADALAALARQAESAGDLAAVAAWRRRHVALDPLDSTTTLALVDALARVGDAAGALRAARIHEALVTEQLDLPLSPALRARVAELQAAPTPIVAPAPRIAPAEAAPPVAAGRAAEPERPPVVAAAPPRRRRAVAIAALLVGAAGVFVAGMALERRRHVLPPAVAPHATGTVVAVVPFALDTRDPTFAYLRDGAADALARMLTSDVGLRAVDPGTVLAAVARSAPPGAVETPDGARQVARTLGADAVLIGRVSGTHARMTITAELSDVATGAQRATAEASGPADSLGALLTTIATRIVAGAELGGERAGAFASVSLPTLRDYLRAEAAAHDDRVEDAVRLYELALERDSTFALAALGLAEAADRYNGAEQHDRGLALAWAARDRLSESDRAYLLALAGPRYPAPSPSVEHLAAWERAVQLSPDRASAWSAFGQRLLYDGAAVGLRAAGARAAAAFRRALELDPEHEPTLRALVELAAFTGDTATLRDLAQPARLRQFGGNLTGYLLWRAATVRRDSAALDRVRQQLPSLGVPSLRAIAMAAQHTGIDQGDGERALRILAARAALGSEQLDVLLAEHSLALNQGRPILALDVTERLQDAQPNARAYLRLRVLDALYAHGDTTAAIAAAAELARTSSGPMRADEPGRALRLADLCVLTQWTAARIRSDRDAASVRAAIVELRRGPLPRVLVPVEVTAPACADLVDAMLAVALGAPDALRHTERVDALMLTGPAIGDARNYANLVVARLYAKLGEPRRALTAVRQRAYLRGWPRYLATMLYEEARLAETVGDATAARDAARRYLALRDAPEPALRGEVASMTRLAAPPPISARPSSSGL